VKRKIALFCNVEFGAVIESRDVPTIYQIPLLFHEQGLDERVMHKLGLLGKRAPDLSKWRQMVERIMQPHGKVRIAVIGKYTGLVDSYKSVQEALIHGGIANDVGVEISWLASDLFSSREKTRELLADFHGVLVPGGFGVRGVEGMLEAIRYARESGLPFFGICLGMQTAIIEFARNVMGLADSHSSEFAPECGNAVISLMEDQQHITDMGGTMRLGAYPCRLGQGTQAATIYGTAQVSERHRHRYEVNNKYREQIAAEGLVFSGTSPDGKLVEYVELPREVHPYYVATQAHPELSSRPTRPHPLFAGLVKAALDHQSGSAGTGFAPAAAGSGKATAE
jgi:CTP synthase